MGRAKGMQMNQEQEEFEKKERQRKGYRMKLESNDDYSSIDCPRCDWALSKDAAKEQSCPHCDNIFEWNKK